MKKIVLVALVGALGITSCKSVTTAADVRKQQQKATKSLKEAHEEMIELASMKEKYSADAKKEELKEMKARLDQVGEEIKKADALTNSANSEVKASSKSAVNSLKAEQQKLKADIATIENRQVENWSEVKKDINEKVMVLENNVKTVTGNLPKEGE